MSAFAPSNIDLNAPPVPPRPRNQREAMMAASNLKADQAKVDQIMGFMGTDMGWDRSMVEKALVVRVESRFDARMQVG